MKKMMKKLRLLDCIKQYTAANGYPPTVRELKDMLGVGSTSTIHAYLKELYAEGIISYEATKPRTLTIIA